MKNSLIALTTSLLLCTPAAYAASTVDLTVKGLITPSACTPTLGGGGVIDHGKISAKDLRSDGPSTIGTHTLPLAVSCDAATTFALHSIDNRANSAITPSSYGLGLINDTQKLGGFTLTLLNTVADGMVVQPIASADQGDTWYSDNIWLWESGLYLSVASMDDKTRPVAVKELVADLQVQTTIARTDGLDLSNEVSIDGSATLEVKYL